MCVNLQKERTLQGRIFILMKRLLEVGGELGPGDMDKNQFGSDPSLEPPQAFHLEQALG